MTEFFQEYLRLLFKMHREQKLQGESDNVDKIANQMDPLWTQLTDDERKTVGFVSELLHQELG
jgi:hypothetical protein